MRKRKKKACFIKRLDGFTGEALLFRLAAGKHVVVSATVAFGTCETYIFEADENGKVLSWSELPGSYRGGIDHREALARAGYEVIS